MAEKAANSSSVNTRPGWLFAISDLLELAICDNPGLNSASLLLQYNLLIQKNRPHDQKKTCGWMHEENNKKKNRQGHEEGGRTVV
jgi:hypothetical protein